MSLPTSIDPNQALTALVETASWLGVVAAFLFQMTRIMNRWLQESDGNGGSLLGLPGRRAFLHITCALAALGFSQGLANAALTMLAVGTIANVAAFLPDAGPLLGFVAAVVMIAFGTGALVLLSNTLVRRVGDELTVLLIRLQRQVAIAQ